MKQLSIPGARRHSGRTFPRLPSDEAMRQWARQQRKAAMAVTTQTITDQLDDVRRQLIATRKAIQELDAEAKAYTDAKLAERGDLLRSYTRLEGAVVALSTALGVPIDMGVGPLVPTSDEPPPGEANGAAGPALEIVRG
jgi:hypothetical protein